MTLRILFTDSEEGERPLHLVDFHLAFNDRHRICPGRFFADGTVWLTIACTLACFDIKPVEDPATGAEIPPDVEYLPSVIR